jgi:hypothetical protein
MGQYWKPINIDKKEYIHPHTLGAGLKLWEQLANHPGIGEALIILLALPACNGRGGGDLRPHPVIGRWAGDRVILVGDYAEPEDYEDIINLDNHLYDECHDEGSFTDISDMVAEVIESELRVKYQGDGWREAVDQR